MKTLSHESRELELYIENTEAFYATLERLTAGHWNKGSFDIEKGIKGAMHTVNRAAKQYKIEFGSITDSWSTMFSASDRKATAESLVRGLVEECKLGNYGA